MSSQLTPQDTREVTAAGRTYLVYDPVPSLLKEERKRTLRKVNQTTTQMLQDDVNLESASSVEGTDPADAVNSFLASRPNPREGTRGTRDGFYGVYLPKSIPILGFMPTPSQIDSFVKSRDCKPGGQAAYFRAIRAFFNWLYSPVSGFNFKREDNPIHVGGEWLKCPRVPDQDLRPRPRRPWWFFSPKPGTFVTKRSSPPTSRAGQGSQRLPKFMSLIFSGTNGRSGLSPKAAMKFTTPFTR